MQRRVFLERVITGMFAGAGCAILGCRHKQHAQILRPDQKDMVGSHAAGASTFRPLIEETVDKLLARHCHVQTVAHPVAPRRICFVGLENKSSEELGDFKAQIIESIDNRIVQSRVFQPISRRFVQVGLREARLRPDELLVPDKRRLFLQIMEKQGQAFEYLLYASLTSGTTHVNGDFQRDYLLTLELVDVESGAPDKESTMLRKGYHKSRLSRWKNS